MHKLIPKWTEKSNILQIDLSGVECIYASYRESLWCVKHILVCMGWGAEIEAVVFMVGFSADSLGG